MEKEPQLESVLLYEICPESPKNTDWFNDLKNILKKSGLKRREDITTLNLKDVKSTSPWNFRLMINRGEKGVFTFVTLADPENLETLRLWDVPVEDYAEMETVDLDSMSPTLSGKDARRFLVDEFYEHA